jgi:hypothetical protein
MSEYWWKKSARVIPLTNMGMKRLSFVLFIAAPLIFTSCNQRKLFIEPDNPSIIYNGRIDFNDPKHPVFMYSGVNIRIAFSGTGICIILKDDSAKNRFNIRLDNSEFTLETRKDDSVYCIADTLINTTHNLEITRITEWHGGNTVFSGFFISGKGLIPVFPRKRKIEFIGNSITCGYGTEGKSHNEHFTYKTQNCLHTYAAYTAKNLDADFTMVCRSGIGIYQSYGGDKEFAMPLLYKEVVSGSRRKWDFTKFKPDVVVIELGSNDLSSNVDSAKYTDAYIGFLKELRGYYPAAKIVCLSGPGGLNDEKHNMHFQNLVRGVVTEATQKLDEIYFYNLEPTEHNGSDWHPSSGEHKNLSVGLTACLKSLMNWQ